MASGGLARRPAVAAPSRRQAGAKLGARNKYRRQRLSWRAGQSFPLPRAWPAALGAVDMPIDCASTFLRLRKSAAAHGFKGLYLKALHSKAPHFNACKSTAKTAMAGTSPAIAKRQKCYL